MPRPSDYGPEIAGTICTRLADGQTLREICRDDTMPDRETVRRWLLRHDEFRGQYAQAREDQADHFADEIAEIADDGSNDWMERKRQDGSTETVFDHEHVQRSKLRIETRRWLMAKAAPKKYGDKQVVEHAGSVEVTTKEQRDAAVAAALRADR